MSNESAAAAAAVEDKHSRARTHTTDIGGSRRGVAFQEYQRSWLTPFFGSNTPEPLLARDANHPCTLLSQHVHACLDEHRNNVDFCQSKVARFQSCLNEFNM